MPHTTQHIAKQLNRFHGSTEEQVRRLIDTPRAGREIRSPAESNRSPYLGLSYPHGVLVHLPVVIASAIGSASEKINDLHDHNRTCMDRLDCNDYLNRIDIQRRDTGSQSLWDINFRFHQPGNSAVVPAHSLLTEIPPGDPQVALYGLERLAGIIWETFTNRSRWRNKPYRVKTNRGAQTDGEAFKELTGLLAYPNVRINLGSEYLSVWKNGGYAEPDCRWSLDQGPR